MHFIKKLKKNGLTGSAAPESAVDRKAGFGTVWKYRDTAIAFITALGIFIFDLYIPLGYAIWLLFLVPLFLVAHTMNKPSLFAFTSLITLFTILDLVHHRSGAHLDVAYANRALGIFVFWTITMIISKRIDSERKLELTLSELKRSNRELEKFAYIASHDLQEPLRMVSSFVQLLARRYRGKLDSDADEFIGFAVDGAARMKMLIDDLLTYSRVGTQGKPFTRVDAKEAVDRAVQNLKVPVEESGAQIILSGLPAITADESQIVQLFQNLIGNAVKFRGKEPPVVRISAERKGHDWVFGVIDNGIGIDPQYSDRIFQIFQRLHTREEYPGTGIGLALCKKIVERHGGAIRVESEPGRGSSFFFTIPADRAE